jgi:hypothetical protein
MVVVVTACGGGSTTLTELSGPTASRCEANAAASSRTIAAAGGRLTLTVTTGRECGWSVASDVTWLQLSPTSGQGDAAVDVRVASNANRNSRSGTISLGSTRVVVTQDAAPPPPPPPDPPPGPAPAPPTPAPTPAPPANGPLPPSPPAPPPSPAPSCTFQLATDPQSFASDGGSGRVRVTTTASCEWNASADASWIDLPSPRSGRGSGDLQFRVDRNSSSSSRRGSITVGGNTQRIDQAGAAPPSPPPTPPPAQSCEFELSPDRRRVDDEGGEQHFNVKVSSRCGWSASSSVPWISVSSGSGPGDGRVEYRVQRNESTQDRSGRISVGGQSHDVEQRGRRR